MSKRLVLYLGGAAIIVAALFSLWILGQTATDNQSIIISPNVQSPGEAVVAERDVTLYFASPDASHLISTTTRIGCVDELSCLREVVESLIRGPLNDTLPVIPHRAHLQNLQIEEDLVILDFDSQFIEGHLGGSQGELLTVYALTNSVAVNFSHLRQVQITINGATVDTLKGHVDLRRPVLADFTYSKRITDFDHAKEE